MRLGTDSLDAGGDAYDDVENTLIIPGLTTLAPAELGGDRLIEQDRDLHDAEAHTVIVSRSDARHGERVSEPAPVADVEAQKAHFAIRIGTHAPIPLDVPALIGRRPSTPRITGGRMPRLVTVPSPTREVSSTHVEILQAADTVVVTDRGSTNGTTVTMPGFPPQTLRQGESLVVGDEAVVDIGEGIRIIIVALPEVVTTEGIL